jgi:predicted amidohydrolase
MKSYLAAAIQMTSQPNLEKISLPPEELIELAVGKGAELIGLPENFAFMGAETDKIAQAETIALKADKFLRTMAQRFQVTILGKVFPCR